MSKELAEIVVIAALGSARFGVVVAKEERLVDGEETREVTVRFEEHGSVKGFDEVKLPEDKPVEIDKYESGRTLGFFKEHAGFSWAEAEATRLKTPPPKAAAAPAVPAVPTEEIPF